MNMETRISEIMTSKVFVLETTDTIRHAAQTFGNHSLRHAPVLSGGELVGMLSLVDIKNTHYYGSMEEQVVPVENLIVGNVMTPDPVAVQSYHTIREVATLFAENEFHAVPVLDGDRVVGIVSTTDIIQYLLACCDVEDGGDED